MDPMQFVGEGSPPATTPAGAADPLSFMADAPPAAAASPLGDAFGDGAPIGGGAAAPAVAGSAEPAFAMPTMGASPGGGAGGFDASAFDGLPLASDSAPMAGGGSVIPEATPLREWEDEHSRALEDLENKEAAERKEKKTAAEKDLKNWLEEQKIGYQKRQALNREEEKEFIATRDASLRGSTTNPWERVSTLIDTNARAGEQKDEKDLARMKALLIQLKTNPPAALTA